jgi:glycosyltransferase involved in cell wall biosynthesis
MNSHPVEMTDPKTLSAPSYVLMTAAYNEEAFIEKTITSVLQQTVLPKKWVIISDNSIDGTDAIIDRYAKQHAFIHFVRVTRAPGHSFSSKVLALRNAVTALQDVQYEFIGNLDADVSIGATYFADLIRRFEHFPRLGIVSGFIYERSGAEFKSRPSNRVESVPHAAQLVRRDCYEAIEGYAALKYGGEDWHAQICANMKGWDIEALPQLPIYHYKPTGAGANLLRHRFRLGRLDYSFGSHPVFEILKCLIRLPERPVVIGAALRLAGFAWCYLRGEERGVSPECVTFLRRQQVERLWLFRQPNYSKDKVTTGTALPEQF